MALPTNTRQARTNRPKSPSTAVMAALRQATSRGTVHLLHQSGTFSHRQLFTRAAALAPRSPIRTGLYSAVFAISAGLFAVYYFDARSAIHRYLLTPLLRHAFDAETGHKLAVQVLRSGLGPKDPVPDDPRLKLEVVVFNPTQSYCNLVH